MAEEPQRILDEQGNELTKEQADTTLGRLYSDAIVKEHHEATEEQPEEGHYYPKVFYFENGDPYYVQMDGEADPHVRAREEEATFDFVAQTPEEATLVSRGIDVQWIVDKEQVPAREAYDEYEEIQRYHKYTDEELKEMEEREAEDKRQSDFLTNGPEQLETNTSSINDLTVIVSEMVGV